MSWLDYVAPSEDEPPTWMSGSAKDYLNLRASQLGSGLGSVLQPGKPSGFASAPAGEFFRNLFGRKAPASTPEPAPGYDGGAGRARNRQSFTPTMRNEFARNRGALTGAALGSTPYVNPLFQVVGTTGGSPGYDNRASVAAYYQDLKNQAGGRYGQARGDIGRTYDELAAMYQPMAAATAAAYDDAIAGGASESEALMAATQERINSDAAMRAAQYGELGIDVTPDSEVAAEAERGMSNIGAAQSEWSGLMGALGTAAQNRFQSDYVGAGETKAMAQTDLVNAYQNYLNTLQAEETQAMQGAYQPGSAGTPQMLIDTLPTAIQTELYRQNLIEQGLLPDPNANVDPMADIYSLAPKEWQMANLMQQQGIMTPELMQAFIAAQEDELGYRVGTADPRALMLGVGPGYTP
jgi:hypothetical protein